MQQCCGGSLNTKKKKKKDTGHLKNQERAGSTIDNRLQTGLSSVATDKQQEGCYAILNNMRDFNQQRAAS